MKNAIKVIAILISKLLLAAACSNSEDKQSNSAVKSYKLDSGKSIKIPKNSKRIVVTADTYAGGIKYLDGHIVGVNKDVEQSDILDKQFKKTKKINPENVEEITKLKPDLIIADSDDKNLKKFEKITKTIPMAYGKRDYLKTQIQLGKLLNKQEKAEQWVNDWKKQTAKDEKEIKNHIGNDSTVSIFDDFNKEYYAFGKNWGRGGEILYQAFNLKMPKSLEKVVEKDGYKPLSLESMPKYAGDYIFTMSEGKASPEFEKTKVWQNMPAVKQHHVYHVKAENFWYNDPYSLEANRETLKSHLLE
ncbi:ABC transporter substrate-binding protein [Staphylococcus saprophyticus]|uniref:ABC transporter substrate-binding protein n=1 Tax=Staphylococcus saprophyticus TaxID=29385 RepID=UPI000A56909F|nr:ABC transporter substrate-binding protein [Staphylococcus saprophyticus]WMM15364.1 ABC transporter substrate-binding protein [Staphylococcus saprophyticus]